LEWFGFATVTQFRILLLLDRNKVNEINNVRSLLHGIYEIYRQDSFSPFGNSMPSEGKMTLGFGKKIETHLEHNAIL